MDLITGIKERRSVRRFADKPVPRELIAEVVEIARFAPSWKNTQIARYIVVEDPEKIAALASDKCTYGFEYNIKTIAKAPAVVLLTIVEGRSGFEKDGSFSTPKEDRWQNFDAGIAAQTFCLAAYEKGLGSVILGYFDDAEVKKVIPIPEGQQVGAIIPIGFLPEGEVAAPPRKDVSALLTFISACGNARGTFSITHFICSSSVHLSRALRLRRREYRGAAQAKIKAACEARKMRTRQAARRETKKASAVFRYVLRDEFEKTSESSHFRDFYAKR